MMMSKPVPEAEEEAPPAFASPPSAAKTGSVEDLERRLAMLGGEEEKRPAAGVMDTPQATVVSPVLEAPAAVKGGKNALLVSDFF
jgi:hypothetical protein